MVPMLIPMFAVSAIVSGTAFDGWIIHEFDVSAYCTCRKCCGKYSDGITASGRKAQGKLIAAPKAYKFGTQMIVPGYGHARVWDRGGAIKSKGSWVRGIRIGDQRVRDKKLKLDRIDLLFESHRDALKWGRQRLFVLVRQDL